MQKKKKQTKENKEQKEKILCTKWLKAGQLNGLPKIFLTNPEYTAKKSGKLLLQILYH